MRAMMYCFICSCVFVEQNEYKTVIKELQESIRAATSFEQSISSLEYSVILLDDYHGRSQNLYGLQKEFLNLHNLDDYATTIDIQINKKFIQSKSDLIFDIMTCLESIFANGKNHQNFTERIHIAGHTVKNKNLKNFEMISDELNTIDHIYDIIQVGLARSVNLQIKRFMLSYIPDLLIATIANYFYDKCRSSNVCRDDQQQNVEIDYATILTEVIDVFENGVLTNEIYNLTMEYFGSNVSYIEALTSDIMTYQEKANCICFDRISTEKIIIREYEKKLENLVRNNTTIVVDQIMVNLHNLPSTDFRKFYGWYIMRIQQVVSANSKKAATFYIGVIEDVYHMEEDDWSNFDASNKMFFKTIGLFDALDGIKKANFAQSLLPLQPIIDKICIKIVCNCKITKKNIYFLHHILCNIVDNFIIDKSQIIYVNIRQWMAMHTLSRIIQRSVFYDQKSLVTSHFESNVNIKLITKKKCKTFSIKSSFDCRQFLETYATLHINDIDGINNKVCEIFDQNKIKIKMQKCYKLHLQKMKRAVVIGFLPKSRSELRNFCFTKNDFIIDDINNATKEGAGDSMLVLNTFDGNTLKKMGDYDSTSFSVSTYNFTKLLRLEVTRYARIAQQMPVTYTLPKFKFGKLKLFFAKETRHVIYDNSPAKLIEKINNRLTQVNKQIIHILGSTDTTSSICALEIPLSIILRRNVDTNLWKEATSEFLTDCCMDVRTFNIILNDFLFDQNILSATSDYDISNINTNDYDIKIIVILRKNCNTLVYIVRREIEYDLRNLASDFALNFYNDQLHDTTYTKMSNPINCIKATRQLSINPIHCILKSMIDLKFNMFGNLWNQIKKQEDNFYKNLIMLMNPYLRHTIPIIEELHIGSNINTKNTKLYNMCLLEVLKKETEKIINKIESNLKKYKSRGAIKITALSLCSPDYQDMEDIEALDATLKSAFCITKERSPKK